VPPTLRPFLDSLGSIAVVHDVENHVVEMNTEAESFTGVPASQLRGLHFWREIIAADDVDRYRRQFAEPRDVVLPSGYETWWALRDGRRRLMVWNHRRLRWDGDDLLITIAMDVTDRREQEERLQYLAYHDALTGLPNRRRFIDELEHRLASARRYEESLAVLMIDVDALKAVNDSFGHAAGDDVLNEVAARLRARLRTSDMPARLGGDEFAVLLPRADRARAEHVALEVAHAVAGHPLSAGGGTTTTVSVGIAAFPVDAATGSDLMRVADGRLYSGRAQRRPEGAARGTDEHRTRAVLERQALREEMRAPTLSDALRDRSSPSGGDPR
jgi:diguanylate cyclase (GGDEF)-like protein/PAS domain S-box-containing protein